MLFPSYLFLLAFLPITWTIYWYVIPAGYLRRIGVLVAGLVFYAYAGLHYLALLLILAGITFFAARNLTGSASTFRRKAGLFLGFTPLLILAVFKFSGVWHALFAVAANERTGIWEVALPLGISFYTFNLLGYHLDVYRKRIPPASSLLTFASYITFFPTVASGPLVRYTDFDQQFTETPETKRPNNSDLEMGLLFLSIGLAKKLIIADQLADIINPLFVQYDELGFWGAWFVVIGYTYQLYFDFSGYTDMAIGIGRLLGFQLPKNFAAPYTARNITEFWRRWHITLSTWFREYLFFPLSRMFLRRLKNPNSDVIRTVSLIITMTLIGLWHGATGMFVIWGAYHGVLLAIHAQSRFWHWRPLPLVLARGITFLAVVFGWVIFRSTSLDMATNLYASLLGFKGFDMGILYLSGIGVRKFLFMASLIIITNLSWDTADIRPRSGWAYAASAALLLTFSLMRIGEPVPFLYFRF